MTEQHGVIDTSKPHSARMYDYYLGGKDWFEADRKAAEQAIASFPSTPVVARENRAFMHRAIRALTREHGIKQFLDIGTGIPTEPNLHQIAQENVPDARIVYVDNDPLVVEYTDALMRGTPEGRTTYIEADIRHAAILENEHVRDVLDFEQPVALSLVALMHFIPDDLSPYAMVRGLLDGLPAGSFLVLSHTTDEFAPEDARRGEEIYRRNGIAYQIRPRAAIERFFDGLELLEPGVTTTHRWRPDQEPVHEDFQVSTFAGVARKS